MAEEIQPTKRHKPSETHTQDDLPQGTPIGEDLDSQTLIPAGEEENKQIPLNDLESDKEENTFNDSDARKSLDDCLFSITKDLPDLKNSHGLISANMLGIVEQIDNSRFKHQACQFLRRSLNKSITLIGDSIFAVKEEINALENTVTEQKDTVDILKAKVVKTRKLLKVSQQDEDGDLAFQSQELEETITKLTGELAPQEQLYLESITQLKLLVQRHANLVQGKGDWEITLKAIKNAINTQKRAHNKRQSAGASAGSTEPDLSNVEEWSLSSAGPRTATQRVRDPLSAMNIYDRLSCMWASQPMGTQHPFNRVVDRSTLTPPTGGENKRVLCKASATIIFYLLPEDTALALRYINTLDFPRPATLLRVIKPKGNRAGEPQIPVVITRLTAYIWRLLTQRVIYFTPTLAVGIRHAVNDENTETPRHAWVERMPNHIKWAPRNYPFDVQHIIKTLLDCDAILMPKRLDMSWYEAICLSTSGMDIVFKTTSELAKFMGHTEEDIPLYIAQGGVSNTTARVMGETFTMDVPLGPYAVDFLNIPRTITAERLLEVLVDTGLQPQGFRDVTRGRDARAPIFRVGFPNKQSRHEAVLTLSGQIIPGLSRAPLRVSLARDIPKGHCYNCGKKGHSARDKDKCFQTCRICHEPLVTVEDGNTHDHECLYIQEEYDPRSFKKQFHSASRSSSIAPTTPRTRPSYFTSALGHMPTQGRSSPPNPPPAQHPGALRSPPPAFAPSSAPQTLTFEQFQQQQIDLQQQQYQAYLQQQQQLQYPTQSQQPFQQQPRYITSPQPPMQMQQQHQPYPPRMMQQPPMHSNHNPLLEAQSITECSLTRSLTHRLLCHTIALLVE